MDPNSNDSSSDCFASMRTLAQVVIGLRSTISIINCICLFGMICVIFLLKKYHVFTQRLILYLAIASFLLSLVTAFDVTGAARLSNKPALQYCVFVAFANQICNWWVFLAVASILVDLFVKAVFDISTQRFEILHIVLTFGLPFTFCWVPFLKSKFGSSSVYCWIKLFNDKCERDKYSVHLSFYIFYIPLYTLMVFIIVMLVIALILVHRKRTRWLGVYNPETNRLQKMMVKEIYTLIGYPFVFLILSLPDTIHTVFALSQTPNFRVYFGLVVFATLIYQLQGVAITLCFVLDSETRKNLKWSTLKAAAKQCCSKEESYTRLPIQAAIGDSYKYDDDEHKTYSAIKD